MSLAWNVFAFEAIALASLVIHVSSCTTFGVGRLATVDGSTLSAHSNDGSGDTDPRLVRVPAREYKQGDMRPIYASPESYPRFPDMNITGPASPLKYVHCTGY